MIEGSPKEALRDGVIPTMGSRLSKLLVPGAVLGLLVVLMAAPSSREPRSHPGVRAEAVPSGRRARSPAEVIADLRASTEVWCSDARRARALAYGETCVPWDSIPSIDRPRFIDAAEAASLTPADPVVVLDLEGEHRAYPVAILSYHEIVNDVVAGRPVVVTFCPLCNSAVAFSREVAGRTLTFGVSGQLAGANLVMFDRETVSRWQQLTGRATSGPFEGAELELVPVRMVSFGSWLAAHPGGMILAEPDGSRFNYGIDPYVGYDVDPNQPSFVYDPPGVVGPAEPTDPRLPPKWRVVGVVTDDGALAFPVPSGKGRMAVVTGRLGKIPLVAFFQFGLAQPEKAYEFSAAPRGWAGTVFVARLGGRDLSFSTNGAGTFIERVTGSRFDAFGRGISGPLAGRTLPTVPHATAFWFAWSHFYPDTEVATALRS